MRHKTNQGLCVLMLLLGFYMTESGVQLSHAQTSVQALWDRIMELEKRLADAKIRLQKTHDVQIQLEKQEQKIADLSRHSGKYQVEIAEIRADIRSIYARIETITNEKNDLEENLKLAKAILNDIKLVGKPTTGISNISGNSEPEKNLNAVKLEKSVPSATTSKSEIPTESESWQIEKIQLDENLTPIEIKEIIEIIKIGQHVNQDFLLDSAYKVYNSLGIILRFIVYPNNNRPAANLGIVYYRAVAQGRSRAGFGWGAIIPPALTRDQFEKQTGFSVKIEK